MTVTQRGSQLVGRAMPTAQALLLPVADTPLSWASPVGLGLGTTVQAVPFQCSIRVCWSSGKLAAPTAQALLAEVAVMPSMESQAPTLGLGTRVQEVPFQC